MNDIETKAIHAGRPSPRMAGAIVTPIFQSSTFEYHGEAYHDVPYMRLSNTPNHRELNSRIAALEEAESAIVTGSGMAAISGTLFSLLSQGDHVLVQDCVYGGTRGLFDNELRRMGITYTLVDLEDSASWASSLRGTTRAIYVETLSNPLIQVADLEAIVKFARDNGILSIVDNTFASPVNCAPIRFGFDLVIESCTKYLSGHHDVIAGCVAGSATQIASVKRTLDHLGGHLDAHACFLLERGLKTLALRVNHQSRSAQRLASELAHHDAVRVVHYPGLESHRHHQLAKRQLINAGAMMSFELKGGLGAAERFLSAVSIPVVAGSLGGAVSLLVRPAAAVHSALSPEERAQVGISEDLIRFSVGLESCDDLLEDFQRALDTIGASLETRDDLKQ